MVKVTLPIIVMKLEAGLAILAPISSIQLRIAAKCNLWSTAGLRIFDAVRNWLVRIPLSTLCTWDAKERAVRGILAVLGKVGTVRWAIFVLICVGSNLLRGAASQTSARMMAGVFPWRLPSFQTRIGFEEAALR